MNTIHAFQAIAYAHSFAIAVGYMTFAILAPIFFKVTFPNITKVNRQFQAALNINRVAYVLVSVASCFFIGLCFPALTLLAIISILPSAVVALPFLRKLDRSFA